MFKVFVFLLAAFGAAFLLPIPGCMPIAMLTLGSVAIGLLLAQ
jgi:hypothetical protein